MAKEEVLPFWVRRLDTLRIGLRSNVWVHARGLPIRGWLLQQVIKLAVAEQLTADVLVHADSDVVLLRPFSTASVIDADGRVRLYARPDDVDETLPDHVRWHRSAEKLLGIDPADLPMPNYISSLVPWRRANAVALLEHVQTTTGRHWLRALAAAWDVSEYTLYGRFAQDVLGERANQFVSAAPLCHDYYKRVPLSVPELEVLLDGIGREEVAVSLTSKAGMKPAQYVEVLEQRWASPGPEVAGDEATDGEEVGAPSRGGRRRARPRARRPASRVGSASRHGQLMAEANRYRIKWASIVVLVALVLLLLEFGID